MDATDVQRALDAALEHYANARWRETEALCRRILAEVPDHAPALHLLGTLALRAGFLDDAIGLMQRAAALQPDVVAYHSNLGVALTSAGRLDEAIASCREAAARDALFTDAHYNLGNALGAAGAAEEAVAAYQRAIALRFDYPQAHNNLGNVLVQLGRRPEAVAAYRQALFFQPDYAHASSNVGDALEALGRADEARDAHRAAVAAAPGAADIHSGLIAHLRRQGDADATRAESDAWDRIHAAPLLAFTTPHANDRTPDRRLRVGYVLPDPRLHRAAHDLLPLLRARDRESMHATVYAVGSATDEAVSGLRETSDAWVGLNTSSDEAAAQRIRNDAIDILVDLAGHDRANRLLLFARRPAPIQLAHPAVTATSTVSLDARLSDGEGDDFASDVPAVPVMRMPAGDIAAAYRGLWRTWCATPGH